MTYINHTLVQPSTHVDCLCSKLQKNLFLVGCKHPPPFPGWLLENTKTQWERPCSPGFQATPTRLLITFTRMGQTSGGRKDGAPQNMEHTQQLLRHRNKKRTYPVYISVLNKIYVSLRQEAFSSDRSQ